VRRKILGPFAGQLTGYRAIAEMIHFYSHIMATSDSSVVIATMKEDWHAISPFHFRYPLGRDVLIVSCHAVVVLVVSMPPDI